MQTFVCWVQKTEQNERYVFWFGTSPYSLSLRSKTRHPFDELFSYRPYRIGLIEHALLANRSQLRLSEPCA